MRFAKLDLHATNEALISGRFKDKRSRIGIRPDGTQLVRLFGKDMEALRNEVFERDGRCVDYEFSAVVGECDGPDELSHKIPRGRGGSDTPENTCRRCKVHHIYYDLNGCPGHF
jgi:hypothetical protein